jgi:hypothetical protein
MSFHKQSFHTRFQAMGDEAEGIFLTLHPNKYVRIGLDRPPFSMQGMPINMRATPDFIGRLHFVEVQGIGRDRTLKLKENKTNALFIWNKYIGPVDLFVWDRTNKHTYQAPLADWMVAVGAHGVEGAYPEGHKYYGLNVSDFPVEGTPLPEGFGEEVDSTS